MIENNKKIVNLENEIWKDIRGYEGIYKISSYGRVWSLKRKGVVKEKILSQTYNNNGYLRISLNKNNKSKSILVHRLVAQSFIPNPNNLPCVNHKDENKLNNQVDNLEWCTHKYNNNYGTIKQRSGETLKKSGKVKYGNNGNAKKVFYDGKIYESLSKFCDEFGFKHSQISRWLNNKRCMPQDFIDKKLRYEDDNNTI